MDMFSLSGKVAVISGGAGLYGRQMVKALAMAGAKVYMASRNIEKNREVADELCRNGYNVEASYLDLGDEESILRLRDEIYSKENKVDILVNNSVLRTMQQINMSWQNGK